MNINTLRPRQNGRHFADDTFKRIFLNENARISIKISPKFVPKGPINNIPALVQIMAWGRPGDKPLSEPIYDNLPTHICVTRPQWVNVSKLKAVSMLIYHRHFTTTTHIILTESGTYLKWTFREITSMCPNTWGLIQFSQGIICT